MKRTLLRLGLLLALLAWLPGPASGGISGAGAASIDWQAILRALGIALDSWRLSPSPSPTETPLPERPNPPTATATGTATHLPPPPWTPTQTRTATRISTPTRTATRTIAPTHTRPPTSTRAPTRTRTATHAATPTPARTATRTSTSTRTRTWTPTWTRTPVLTATPTRTLDPSAATPTRGANGQIAFDSAQGVPPAQRLASALLVFPYVISEGSRDTRIELINMSDAQQTLNCFYVRESDCVEVGFFLTLTAQQPLFWLASEGTNNPLTFSAVPPFDGIGELKCAVMPNTPNLSSHNVLQGRAVAFDTATGDTVGYGSIGFQRLVPGAFTGVVDLDGFTYEECPERLHFQVLSRGGGADSDMVLVPCAQDLLTQTPTETTVQLQIVNEFEQVFSSSFRFRCHTTLPFSRLGTLGSALLGSDTAHVVVRGVSSPLVGLVIDRFDALGTHHSAANDPFLEGGSPATVIFP
jgi:hypothetical protein